MVVTPHVSSGSGNLTPSGDGRRDRHAIQRHLWRWLGSAGEQVWMSEPYNGERRVHTKSAVHGQLLEWLDVVQPVW